MNKKNKTLTRLFIILIIILITSAIIVGYFINKNTEPITKTNDYVEEIPLEDSLIVSNEKIIEMEDVYLGFEPWSKNSQSFTFEKTITENCGHGICDYETYNYNLEDKKQGKQPSKILITSYTERSRWINSPDKRWAIRISQKEDNQLPPDDAGTIYIKDLLTDEIKNLGAAVSDNNYPLYQFPQWSPDGSKIALYYYEQNAGTQIALLTPETKSVEEFKILEDEVFLREVARADDYFFY